MANCMPRPEALSTDGCAGWTPSTAVILCYNAFDYEEANDEDGDGNGFPRGVSRTPAVGDGSKRPLGLDVVCWRHDHPPAAQDPLPAGVRGLRPGLSHLPGTRPRQKPADGRPQGAGGEPVRGGNRRAHPWALPPPPLSLFYLLS